MKILLVINIKLREWRVMDSIKRELLISNKDAIVEIREINAPKFIRFVFGFKPDVILTFPFTAKHGSDFFYLFKVLLGVKIISMRTEGVVDFESDYEVERTVGYDDYGDNLIHYELSWGAKFARIIGGKLVKQNKLGSLNDVKVVGHPGLENYYSMDIQTELLPLKISKYLKSYKKENIILFVTGFVMADYTKQDLINARDMGGIDNIEIALEGVEIIKRLRVDWVKNIIITAKENPKALVIVKKHPTESRIQYEEYFYGLENVLYIYEDIPISRIISSVGVFVHYGSTSLIDSYIMKIPSIYAFADYNKGWYSNLGWPSSVQVDINDVPETVKNFLDGNLVFNMSDEVKTVMKEMFNIDEAIEYNPSKKISKLILDPEISKTVRITDYYFLKALCNMIYVRTFGLFLVLIKRLKSKSYSLIER